MPIKIVELELTEGLRPIWGMEGYEGLCALVRYHRDLVGWVYIQSPNQAVISPECVCEAMRQQIPWQLLASILRAAPDAALSKTLPLPSISVIVCVSESTVHLEACLQALAGLAYPNYEVIMVDAASAGHGYAQLAAQFAARYMREERSSHAAARNRGITAAHHDIVAFIDGDTQPDRYWLRAIGKGFAQSEVMVVTGCVAPREQETRAQIAFEHGGYGLGRGLRRRTWRRDGLTPTELLWANGFGGGVNMAYRKRVFTEIGPFDPLFQADIPSDGSDIAMFHRVLVAGHTIVYEPTALVWYTPKRDDTSLRWLAYEHGRAFGLYLLTCLRQHTVSRAVLLRFVVRDWLRRYFWQRLLRPGNATRRLVLTELAGALGSPLVYRKGMSDRRLASPATPGNPPTLLAQARQDKRAGATPPRRSVRRHAHPRHGVTIQVVRTWYPHWGQYSGINQFLHYVNQEKYSIETQLVQENDHDFPIQNRAVRRWLGYWVKRQDMAWYNLSDLTAEIKCLNYYGYKKADVIHYLDGEHSAQFLPRLCKLPHSIRPQLVVSYHQPPEVLDEVIRKDNVARSDCIVVVAPEQLEFFKTHAAPEKVRLILHGIDTRYFKPAMRTRVDGTVRCVTVGHNYRDYKTMRQVAAKLSGERDIEFYVVSPRPTGMEGLPNVMVYNSISDERLLRLYQQADILFMPLTKATANNALLEGIACGLPVLSTALPSVQAYLPGPEAILVKDNDPHAFLDAILSLAKCPATRRGMATAARKRAEELDWVHIAPQYEAIYTHLAANN
jgi:glycosyltransferase involved in cell wall biosynthesis/GT2 family glycosyltransferase